MQDRLAWMGVSSLGRAECVMLNKGPHILRRMQAHQSKKRPLLRALKAWDLPLAALVD